MILTSSEMPYYKHVSNARKNPSSTGVQFIVSFVLPTIVLLGFSSEDRLGPVMAMFVALLFPVAYELYSLARRRKTSMLSLIAIGGIVLTGAVTLLGLSENWLALRRSAIYFVAALVLAASVVIKKPLIDMALVHMLDIARVRAAAAERNTTEQLQRRITTTTYALIIFLTLLGISSYILTLLVITAPPETAQFNSEYVRLRVLSLPYTTLPLFVGLIGIMMYLLGSIEKLTGLALEDIIHKKK